jgi:hypothetical protein
MKLVKLHAAKKSLRARLAFGSFTGWILFGWFRKRSLFHSGCTTRENESNLSMPLRHLAQQITDARSGAGCPPPTPRTSVSSAHAARSISTPAGPPDTHTLTTCVPPAAHMSSTVGAETPNRAWRFAQISATMRRELGRGEEAPLLLLLSGTST